MTNVHSIVNETEMTGRLQTRAARVATVGWRLSLGIMAIGLLWSLAKQEAIPHRLASPADIVDGLRDGNPGSLVALAILTILLTPVVTAGTIAWTFWQAGDRRFGAISTVVLTILLTTIALSLR